jgi:hypothetical protein
MLVSLILSMLSSFARSFEEEVRSERPGRMSVCSLGDGMAFAISPHDPSAKASDVARSAGAGESVRSLWARCCSSAATSRRELNLQEAWHRSAQA